MTCARCGKSMNEKDDKVLDVRVNDDLIFDVHWKCWLLCIAYSLETVVRNKEFV